MEPAEPVGALIQVAGATEAHLRSVSHIMENGWTISGDSSPSVRSGQDYREVMDLILQIANPLDRIVASPTWRLNLSRAVARFLWMMAGTDRLNEIEIYDPGAARFSDDGVTLAGSSFGKRIRRAAQA